MLIEAKTYLNAVKTIFSGTKFYYKVSNILTKISKKDKLYFSKNNFSKPSFLSTFFIL